MLIVDGLQTFALPEHGWTLLTVLFRLLTLITIGIDFCVFPSFFINCNFHLLSKKNFFSNLSLLKLSKGDFPAIHVKLLLHEVPKVKDFWPCQLLNLPHKLMQVRNRVDYPFQCFCQFSLAFKSKKGFFIRSHGYALRALQK
jgi:hypothetical protein